MARKFLYFIAFCIVLYLGGRLALQIYPTEMTRLAFTPAGAFEAQPPMRANAYADPAMWVSRPGLGAKDPAQWHPDGFAAEAAPLDVAVFFIHPTSYLRKTHWNAPLDDAEARRIADSMVRMEASPFNRAAQVWSPRYRQATFGAFVSDKPEATQALDLAYGDVALAFDAFVAAIPAGQPIALAGHSQGSLHLKRLLAEKVKGTPLARRVVAAYIVGWPVETGTELDRMGLPACTAPDQAGCVVSFLSFADEGDAAQMTQAYERFAGAGGRTGAEARYLCSNPLTGGIGGAAPPSANRGASVPDAKLEKARIKPALVGARCGEDGMLRIGEGPDMGPYVLPGGNYHVYDYPLYWTNLRDDFARRVAAWRRPR